MSQEWTFRLLLAVLAVVLYVNHHVIHKKPSSPSSKKETLPMGALEVLLIVTPLLWTISLALYVAGFGWFDYSVPLPQWLRWTGVASMVLCLPLSDWVYRTLGAHFSKKLELRTDHQLVNSGPYRYVRHPMYSTLFLCAGATCLVSANLVVMVATLAVIVVVVLRIKKEEEMLEGRFGDAYRAYQATTGALLPKLRGMMT